MSNQELETITKKEADGLFRDYIDDKAHKLIKCELWTNGSLVFGAITEYAKNFTNSDSIEKLQYLVAASFVVSLISKFHVLDGISDGVRDYFTNPLEYISKKYNKKLVN